MPVVCKFTDSQLVVTLHTIRFVWSTIFMGHLYGNFHIGTNWANMTLLDIKRSPIMVEGPSGPYESGMFGDAIWTLKCDCGYTWDIPSDTFGGRRRTPNCGRKECPYVSKIEAGVHTKSAKLKARESRQVKEPNAIYPIYMPVRMAGQIRVYAIRYELTFSKAVVALLTVTLADMGDG